MVRVIGDQVFGNLEHLDLQDSAGIGVMRALKEVLNDQTAETVTGQEEGLRREPEEGGQKRPQMVALLGGFGSNKSTQMKRFVWQTLQDIVPGTAKCCLPIYVDLRGYQPVRATFKNPMELAVLEALGNFWPDLTAGSLAELPTTLGLRIFYYGTDSLTDRDRQEVVNQIRAFA